MPDTQSLVQVYWQRRLWVRLSAQYYNTIKEYARLVEALQALGGQDTGNGDAHITNPAPYWALAWQRGADNEEDDEEEDEDDETEVEQGDFRGASDE